jgi:hypothetical protein
MADPFGAAGSETAHIRKCDFVADTVNQTLRDLAIRCTKTEEIRDYYTVAVIGYSERGVRSALGGALAGRWLVPISELAEYPSRLEMRYKKVSGEGGEIIEQPVRFPVWIDAVAEGGTPMCEALEKTRALLENWTQAHPHSFPPTVLHLTDGESSDGDPRARGAEIMRLSTEDGNALLFNCHISAQRARPVLYPSNESELPDDFARKLFEMSSILPESFRNAAAQLGVRMDEAARGFVFNADPSTVVQFYQIGTSLTGMSPYSWMS